MELDNAQSVATPEAPKEMDPQAAFRMSVAERLEARRLAEIEAAQSSQDPDPDASLLDPEPSPEPEPVQETESSAEQRVEAPQEPARAPQAQPPQLFPLQLPNGAVTYVTGEQLSYLAGRGAMAEMQPPAAPQPAPVPEPKATHPPNFDSDKARAVIKALAYGQDDEDGVRVLQEFMQASVPQIDADAIRREAVQEALGQISFQNTLDALGQEFPDIFGNKRYTQLAVLELNDIRADPNSRHFPDRELYREACRRVRSGLMTQAPQPQPESLSTTNPVSQAASAAPSVRLERKRGAPSVPSASDRRLGAGDDSPRVPTNRDVVNQIRANRGQPPLE